MNKRQIKMLIEAARCVAKCDKDDPISVHAVEDWKVILKELRKMRP